MSALANLARHWIDQTAKGKGLRLDSQDLDLLNAIGVGEFIANSAAQAQRDRFLKRTTRSTAGADTVSNGTASATDRSAHPSSRSSGTTRRQDVIEAGRRAQQMCRPQKQRSIAST